MRDTLVARLKEGFLTLDELRIEQSILRTVDKIIVVACGTAAYAGMDLQGMLLSIGVVFLLRLSWLMSLGIVILL